VLIVYNGVLEMGSKERRERERDEVRNRILDAARELFATFGYDGVSMRKIAEKIEYSPTTIYQYFKDKDALVRDLCYADFGKLAEVFREMLQIADPIESLRQCGESYVRFAVAYPNHYRLMFMTPLPVTHDPAERAEIKGNPETDAYALVRHLVEIAAKSGVLRDPQADLELVTQTLWAGLHGVVALQIAMECNDWLPWRPLELRTTAMVDALCNGLFVKEESCRR
jgi:AcrR family transcriptional regulator